MADISETLDGEVLLRITRAVERFEDAWRCAVPMPLEDVLRAEAAPAARAELLRYALAVELKYRRDRGESPTVEEYERRFPEEMEIIRAAFAEPVTVSIPPGTTIDPSPFGLSDILRLAAPAPESLPEKIGKYNVVGRLGVGGQGSTYLARDPDLGRLVVLKRYHASAHDDVAIQEAQALTRIRSRHTAECFNLERDGDALFLVMEYIPGRCLSDVVKERPLAPGRAARVVEQVAEGLEAVHACGLVHRDLKPSNIVLGDDGVPRLVDFGLAAHLGSATLRGVSGTPPYMAPEQARDQWERINARTDLYGLGAVLYALLTGQPPHPGKTLPEVLMHAHQGVVTPPRAEALDPAPPGAARAAGAGGRPGAAVRHRGGAAPSPATVSSPALVPCGGGPGRRARARRADPVLVVSARRALRAHSLGRCTAEGGLNAGQAAPPQAARGPRRDRLDSLRGPVRG